MMVAWQAPVADDVDWEVLGRSHELAGGSIKNAVVCGATRAALRVKDGQSKITVSPGLCSLCNPYVVGSHGGGRYSPTHSSSNRGLHACRWRT